MLWDKIIPDMSMVRQLVLMLLLCAGVVQVQLPALSAIAVSVGADPICASYRTIDDTSGKADHKAPAKAACVVCIALRQLSLPAPLLPIVTFALFTWTLFFVLRPAPVRAAIVRAPPLYLRGPPII